MSRTSSLLRKPSLFLSSDWNLALPEADASPAWARGAAQSAAATATTSVAARGIARLDFIVLSFRLDCIARCGSAKSAPLQGPAAMVMPEQMTLGDQGVTVSQVARRASISSLIG